MSVVKMPKIRKGGFGGVSGEISSRPRNVELTPEQALQILNKMKAKRTEYYNTHKDKFKKWRENYLKNPANEEKIKAARQKYRITHPEKIKEARQKWYANLDDAKKAQLKANRDKYFASLTEEDKKRMREKRKEHLQEIKRLAALAKAHGLE